MVMSHWSESTPLSAICVAIAIGVAAWSVGLWRLRHPLFIEAETLGHQFLRHTRRLRQ